MARLMSVSAVIGIYWALEWQGIVGMFLALSAFHAAYRLKHGYWLGD